MALYLGGKIHVGTNHLPPRRQLDMSSNIKYIGLGVHKEAIAIAVLNGAGKQVMNRSSKPKRLPLCSSCKVWGESCMSLWKKGPGRPGCTMCSSRTCTNSWSAIHVATLY